MDGKRRAGILAVVIAAASICVVLWMSIRRAARIDAAIENGPLIISASEIGRFAKGYSWSLRVDHAGNAFLEIDSAPAEKSREFVVPKAQLDELRKALRRERFFELADSYGELVADGSTRTLRVSAGGDTKTVELLFLGNWANSEPAKLREPSRAVRILQIIRGWFDDPEAVDLRPYDRIVPDVAKRPE